MMFSVLVILLISSSSRSGYLQLNRISFSTSNFSLKLTSQQLLDNTIAAKQDFLNLLVIPGECHDVSVSLENLSDRPILWQLEVEGDFPDSWCQWFQETAQEIVPGQKIESIIRFKAPLGFFEERFAISSEQPQLKLDYQGQVKVYTEKDEQKYLIGYEIFNLAIRPPSSYMEFLPAFYKEVDFLGRLLAILEETFDPAVQTLDNLWAYLDPLTAPEAMLPFLARWVGWDMDDRWSIDQQRRLIRNAVTLYRWHGTRFGLSFYIHLCTGLPLDEQLPEDEKHISIQEIYSTGFVLGKTQMGMDSMLGGGKKYHFLVRLRAEYPDQVIDEEMVREIIERERPAFCTYELSITYPEAH